MWRAVFTQGVPPSVIRVFYPYSGPYLVACLAVCDVTGQAMLVKGQLASIDLSASGSTDESVICEL